ncbi:hypothetical protein C8R45DRAFT_937248 [Mycena sanguinolenta]|nr:hypothetical protein C8R45DRAFT_937248 [Mycena sanguinolenta]
MVSQAPELNRRTSNELHERGKNRRDPLAAAAAGPPGTAGGRRRTRSRRSWQQEQQGSAAHSGEEELSFLSPQARPSPRRWLGLWLEESETKARSSQAQALACKPSQARKSLVVVAPNNYKVGERDTITSPPRVVETQGLDIGAQLRVAHCARYLWTIARMRATETLETARASHEGKPPRMTSSLVMRKKDGCHTVTHQHLNQLTATSHETDDKDVRDRDAQGMCMCEV